MYGPFEPVRYSLARALGIDISRYGQRGLFEEDQHPRDNAGRFAGKEKPKPIFNKSGQQGKLFSGLNALPGQQDLFEDLDKRDDSISAQQYDANWMTVGGARALVEMDTGQILAGCPGLEGEDLDDLGEHEHPAHRERRERKQEAAEASGWEGQEQKDARNLWHDAMKEAPQADVVLVKIGDTLHTFHDHAGHVKKHADTGDGSAANFKQGHREHVLNKLTEAGLRVAIAEPANDERTDAEVKRQEEPQQKNGPSDNVTQPVTSPSAPKSNQLDLPDQASLRKTLEEFERIAQRFESKLDEDGLDRVRYLMAGAKAFNHPLRRNVPALWAVAARHVFLESGGSQDQANQIWGGPSPFSSPAQKTKGEGQKSTNSASPSPYPSPSPSPKPKTPSAKELLDQRIIAAVGENPNDVAGFRELVEDVWQEKRRQAEQENDALKNLLGQFGYTGAQQGGYIRRVQQAQDPDQLPRFDQIVEMAERYYPQLLDWQHGSHAASANAEEALFQRLKRGLVPPPARHSDEVISEALDIVQAAVSSRPIPSQVPAGYEDWESVPFSLSRSKWWQVTRYQSQQKRANKKKRLTLHDLVLARSLGVPLAPGGDASLDELLLLRSLGPKRDKYAAAEKSAGCCGSFRDELAKALGLVD